MTPYLPPSNWLHIGGSQHGSPWNPYPPVSLVPAWKPYYNPYIKAWCYPPPLLAIPMQIPVLKYPFEHNGTWYFNPPSPAQNPPLPPPTEPRQTPEQNVVTVEESPEEAIKVEEKQEAVVEVEKKQEEVKVDQLDDFFDSPTEDDPVYLDSIVEEEEEYEDIHVASKLRWADNACLTAARSFLCIKKLSKCIYYTDEEFIEVFLPSLLATQPTYGLLKESRSMSEIMAEGNQDEAMKALEACCGKADTYHLICPSIVEEPSRSSREASPASSVDDGYSSSLEMSPSPSKKNKRRISSSQKKTFQLPLERTAFLKELNKKPINAA